MAVFSHAIEEPDYELPTEPSTSRAAPLCAICRGRGRAGHSAEDAGNQAFRSCRLHLRKNKGEKKFAMTAPVTQTARRAHGHDRARDPGRRGGRHAGAVRPAQGVTLATAPEPIDPRVQLRQERAAPGR